jgi:hypothetical protein
MANSFIRRNERVYNVPSLVLADVAVAVNRRDQQFTRGRGHDDEISADLGSSVRICQSNAVLNELTATAPQRPHRNRNGLRALNTVFVRRSELHYILLGGSVR